MSLFSRLFRNPPRFTPPASGARLLVETLEGRAVPAAHVFTHMPGHSAAARHLLTGRETTYDFNDDGKPDRVIVGATKYNAKGQVLESRAYGDFNYDGVIDYTAVTTNSYDTRNLLVGRTFSVAFTGGFSYHSTVTFTNDSRGNPVKTQGSFAYDFNGDGITDFSGTDSSTTTYDNKNNPLTATFTEDDGADGTTDYAETDTYTYDNQGNQLTAKYAFAYYGSGVVVYSETDAVTNTYDGRGNLLTTKFTADYFNDGVIDSVGAGTLTYDSKGHLLSARFVYDYDNNGTTDEVDTTANTYDPNGNLLTSKFVIMGGDGTVYFAETDTYTYDSKGNQTSSSFAYDFDGDGTADATSTGTFSYDSKGNLLTAHYADYEGTTAVDGATYTYTYDNQGNRTSVSGAIDTNGDGVTDYTFTTVFTY
jgi:YD repeat-containing protein